MKRIILLCFYFAVLSCHVLFAQTSYSVNITTPGTLSDQLTYEQWRDVNNLTITGNLNKSDFEVFKNKYNLRFIDMSGTNVEGNEIPAMAFNLNLNLDSVFMPSTVTSVAKAAFMQCYNMKKVKFSPVLKTIGDSAFISTGLTEIVIPEPVETIGNRAFAFCMSLNSVTLPSTLKSMERECFYYSPYLDSINIPSSVTYIGDLAFAFCPEILKITVDDANGMYTDEDGILFNKDLSILISYPAKKDRETYTVPSTVKVIQANAFVQSSSLELLTIPASVIEIGSGLAINCDSLRNIQISEGNPNYSSIDGVLFNKSKTKLLRYPSNRRGGYIIPNSVNSLEPNSFSFAKYLSAVKIPAAVDSIGVSAFVQCAFDSVFIPSSITYIGSSVFDNCQNLKFVSMPNTIDTIPTNFFNGCRSLNSIILPADLKSIESYVFAGCDSLKTIHIPNSVTNIEEGVFFMSGLEKLTIPNSVHNISQSLLLFCDSLSYLTIPSSIDSMGRDALRECISLDTIKFNSSTPIALDPLLTYVFGVNTTTCVLYVPAGSAEAYRTAAHWSTFENLVEYDFILAVSENAFEFDASKDSVAFELTSNTEWTIETESTWLHADTDRGMDSQAITVVADNNSGEERTATIIVSGLGVDDQTITFSQLGVPTGLKNVENSDISIFPHKIDNYLNVENASGMDVSIFNMQGQLMHSEKLDNSHEVIDMTAMPTGIYLIKVGNKAMKVVK